MRILPKEGRFSITIEKNSDILILLESHSTPEVENVWEKEWGGRGLYSHGTAAARGITVLTSKENFEKIDNIYKDEEGRILIFDLTVADHSVTVCAIYAPNEDKPCFFRSVRNQLCQRQEHKILIGDFNLVLDVDMDRDNTYSNNNKAKEELENIMEEFSLKETWRERKPRQ